MGPNDCGLYRQVVLVLRCFNTTEVNNEPAYSGLCTQVVFVCKWSFRQASLYVAMVIHTYSIWCQLLFH